MMTEEEGLEGLDCQRSREMKGFAWVVREEREKVGGKCVWGKKHQRLQVEARVTKTTDDNHCTAR